MRADRFWSKTRAADNGCVEWLGDRSRFGYGVLMVGDWRGRQRRVAHRHAWILTHGPIPEGMLVCHRCDNPPCVNPAHLFLGSHKDNSRDMAAKGRAAGFLGKGEAHPLARLSSEQVADVRRRYSGTGPENQAATLSALAREFGVTRGHLWRIATGRARLHEGMSEVQP